MKSSFLLTLVLSAVMANVAFAQMSTKPRTRKLAPKAKIAPKSNPAPVVSVKTTPPATVEKTSYQKFSDRLKISYFGAITTPHLHDMKHNRWRNAAINPTLQRSPTGSEKAKDVKNQDTWPTNIWQQLSFNYNFGAKMNFVVNPRFMTPFAHPISMKPVEDRSFIMLDDLLIGFQGVVYTSEDKKFNLWLRPGMRIPTSRASRNTGNAGDGNTTHQLELTFSPTYDFNKTWQLGMFGMFRQWVIDDQYGMDRFRSVTNPYVQYTIDEVSKIQVYYELMLETNTRGQPEGERDPIFYDIWQNVSIIYARDITPKLNIAPLVGVFINDTPHITDKSVWAGAWITYQIK